MFKENFTRLCADKNESPSAVCVKIGLTDSAYTKWKDDSVPRKTTLIKIADYFGVTVESLLEDKKEETPPDPWSQTDDEVRARFMQLINDSTEEECELLLQIVEAAKKAYRDKGKK